MAQWCNPLTLKSEQSGGMRSKPGRAPPLEHYDKWSRTRLGLLYFYDPPALGAKKPQLHLHLLTGRITKAKLVAFALLTSEEVIATNISIIFKLQIH